ncbi:hypothetical protein AB0N28_03665 [Streptomyces sp. NPDC051130]|uniref:DUF7448 domain-containing protein n=1 Tax=Streptomyces sp. NPDC051130 TaxID=3157223 RepID=UPI0034425855
MYLDETLDEDDDNGTMPDNVETLREAVVGHRIVHVDVGTPTTDKWGYPSSAALVITLDNGKRVELLNSSDCCAYTELNHFLTYPDRIDHVITGVGTSDGYTTWHIFADMGDVLELSVGWSPGNAFYYGYGFDIRVKELSDGGAAA